MTEWTYEKAGVSIDRKSDAINSLVSELVYRREGRGRNANISGMFAGLIDFGDEYLTLATDGVGTKLLVAKALGRWDTVGIDCVAMNVNDTICVNSEPMAFVDYVAIADPEPEITRAIGVGLNKGAEMSNMDIVGGEIAVLPEMVKAPDLSGTCLGRVDKKDLITGQECEEDDLIVAFRSTGIHSNGLTLARKVFENAGFGLLDKAPGIDGTVGENLIVPTEIYVKQILEITKNYKIHGLINVTGGGLRNLLRLRQGLHYIIDDPMVPHDIFKTIKKLGDVSTNEMYQTFNMGMGFMLVAPSVDAESLAREHENAQIVGRVEKGTGVLFEPENLVYERY
ncbi:MAG TPA: phosphoribosylformylglycinamidine cyclo-ligase [Candidatus Methanomethylophilaceae archaeon]|nr:phosphoribosylformylglycinamidine cyclo-ligase [Candidatus Methanomethylophilaceae archaeon]